MPPKKTVAGKASARDPRQNMTSAERVAAFLAAQAAQRAARQANEGESNASSAAAANSTPTSPQTPPSSATSRPVTPRMGDQTDSPLIINRAPPFLGASPVGPEDAVTHSARPLVNTPHASPRIMNVARRLLFSAPEQPTSGSTVSIDLAAELDRIRGEQSRKWNFDFERNQPLPGSLQWERTSPVREAPAVSITEPAIAVTTTSGVNNPVDTHDNLGSDTNVNTNGMEVTTTTAPPAAAQRPSTSLR